MNWIAVVVPILVASRKIVMDWPKLSQPFISICFPLFEALPKTTGPIPSHSRSALSAVTASARKLASNLRQLTL